MGGSPARFLDGLDCSLTLAGGAGVQFQGHIRIYSQAEFGRYNSRGSQTVAERD